MEKQANKYSSEPLKRTIEMREAGIGRMRKKKAVIRREAEERCAEIDKRIAKNRILLDAIKRGQLAP